MGAETAPAALERISAAGAFVLTKPRRPRGELVVVVDDDGAVLIPAALLDHVLAEAPEQERVEAWIMKEIDRGTALPGLYPMNAETKARYEASKKGR